MAGKPIAVIQGVEIDEDWPDYALREGKRLTLESLADMTLEDLAGVVIEHPRIGRYRPWRYAWGV